MRQTRITFCISILVLAMLACNAVTGVRVAQTEAPNILTEGPKIMNAVETAAAELTPPADFLTPAADSTETSAGGTTSTGGLGVKLEDVKAVMEATQQFTFKNDTVNGQPAAIASLSDIAAAATPELAKGFSAVFVGDPANLSGVQVTIPYSSDNATMQAGLGMMTLIFSSLLPPNMLIKFIPWLTKNYNEMSTSDSTELSIDNIKFTLSRSKMDTRLDIVPIK